MHPNYFRQGIAGVLMKFVLKTFKSNLLVVETGLENGPATNLYEKLGFIEVHQWDRNHGIRKIRFEKHTKNRASPQTYFIYPNIDFKKLSLNVASIILLIKNV